MAIKVANNQSMTGITAMPSAISGGAWTLLSTQTASSSSTISFTSGLDSTYDVYCFTFYNIHPSVHETEFTFNMSVDSGSNYNVTKTTIYFHAAHNEADTAAELDLGVSAGRLGQSTGFQLLGYQIPAGNDECGSGYLRLFNPSSTTYVKHFIARIIETEDNNNAQDVFKAGYFNTTSAIDEIQFKFTSGTMDAGTIKLYGIT